MLSDISKFPSFVNKTGRQPVVAPNGHTQYLECQDELMSQTHEYKYAPMLKLLESEFNCAGICQLPSLFLFSNVNNDVGQPQVLCKDKVTELIKSNQHTVTAFSIFAVLVGFLGFAQSLSVCYYRRNKLKYSWETYQRMKFY